jgi:formylglycine-generating enzyme required for sulfatase activity
MRLSLCLLLAGLALAAPAPAADPPARLINRWGLEFILVPAGRYQVCDGTEADERGPGWVDLPAFYLQATELTRGQWRALGLDGRFGSSEPDLPVDNQSFADAEAVVRRLNSLAGAPLYRLPGEAQWEAACRGAKGPFHDVAGLGDYAWVRANSAGRVQPVARKKPFAGGFFDLLGNLAEWCQEAYSPRLCPGPAEGDPADPGRGLYRVLRGGSFLSTPATARCGWRAFGAPDRRRPEFGLRLVREPVQLLATE